MDEAISATVFVTVFLATFIASPVARYIICLLLIVIVQLLDRAIELLWLKLNTSCMDS